MKTYTIKGWHGKLTHKTNLDAINKIATVEMLDYSWIYTGSIDAFVEEYKRPIVVYGDHIFVTDFNSFGSR